MAETTSTPAPRARILVVGSSNVDFIMSLGRLPSPGETVMGGQFSQAFGGKGANQAVAAARAAGAVTFATGVGDDHVGAQMLESFGRDGIDTRHAVRAPGTPSGSALIMFDRQGHNYIAVAPGANFALLPEHLNAPMFESAQAVVMQMEIPVATTLRALELAQAAQTPVVFNFAPAQSREVRVSDAMTVLVVNEHEAEWLSQMPVRSAGQAFAAARALQAQGPRIVMVTLGGDGVVFVSPASEEHVPAFAASARDTTAAGDTFCGAFAVAWAQAGASESALGEAVRFASAAAAISVTREGAQPSIPHRAEIEALLAQN
jgi:ribokinase